MVRFLRTAGSLSLIFLGICVEQIPAEGATWSCGQITSESTAYCEGTSEADAACHFLDSTGAVIDTKWYIATVQDLPQCTAPAGIFTSATNTPTTATTNTNVNINSVVAASNATAIQAIHDTAENAGGGQTDLVRSADAVNQLGSSQAATVGALLCAHGANTAVEDPQESASDLSRCQQYFSAANAMNARGGKLVPDEGSLNGDAAKVTLTDFEKNFGITGSDYVSQMLDSGGSRESFSRMIAPVLGEAKLKNAFAAADEFAPGGKGDEKFVVDAGKKTAEPKSHLRDALKKSLAEGLKKRVPASKGTGTPVPEAESLKFEGLQPLHEEIFSKGEAPAAELTLFDVVHAKYLELRGRWMKTGFGSKDANAF